jgi:hypothetical protein
MMPKPESQQRDYFTLAVIVTYLFIGLLLIPYYLYRLNPDGISYLEIAAKYSRGEWHNAVNGYWGPLYSWLLALLLYIGFKPLLGAKILSLTVGFLAILGAKRLSRTFNISPVLQRVFIVIAAVNILFFAFVFITPDLFIVCFLLWYASLIWNAQYGRRMQQAVMCGVLGALAYFSKAYAFPFFIIHFTLMNALHYFGVFHKVEKSKLRNSYLAGLGVFLIMSATWISIISCKYDRLIIGTAGTFDAPVNLQSFDGAMPFYFTGFVAPPNPTAMSAWEDPSYTAFQLAAPSTRTLWEKIKFQIITTVKNGYAFWLILWGRYNKYIAVFSLYFNIALVLLALLYARTATQRVQSWIWWSLAGTFLLFCSGYLLMLVDERFFWFLFFILILTGVLLLDKLLSSTRFQASWLRGVFIILFVSLACYRSLTSLMNVKNSGKDYYQTAQILKNDFHIKGRIVSDKNWDASLIICYFMENKYYGRVAKQNLQKEVANDLQRLDIDYMMVWGEADPKWLLGEPLHVTAGVPVKVYAINKR